MDEAAQKLWFGDMKTDREILACLGVLRLEVVFSEDIKLITNGVVSKF